MLDVLFGKAALDLSNTNRQYADAGHRGLLPLSEEARQVVAY